MGAAIGGRGNAPENQDAEEKAAEIVAVGDRHREEIAQQHGDEDIDRDDADERRGDQFDAVDETVHVSALHGAGPFTVRLV